MLSDVLAFMRQHLVILMIGMVLGGVSGAILAWSSDPIYVADSLIQIEHGDAGIDLLSEISGSVGQGTGVAAQIQILKSRAVIGEAVRELRLDVSSSPQWFWLFGKRLAHLGHRFGFDSPPAFMGSAAWIGDTITLGRMEVTGQESLRALVRVTGSESFQVLDYLGQVKAEGVAGQAISFQTGLGGQANMAVREIDARPDVEFLVQKSTLLAATKSVASRLRVSESGLGTGILQVSIQGSDRDRIADIVNAVINAFLRQSVERRSEQAKRSLDFVVEQIPIVRADLESAELLLQEFRTDNQAIDLSAEGQALLNRLVDLERRVSDLTVKREELLRTVTGSHPLVQSVESQLSSLTQQRQTLQSQVSGLPQLQQQILRLSGDVEVARQLYTFLLDKAQELRVVEAGTVGNVRILDSAVTHPNPVSPNPLRSAVLGALLGLLFAVGYVGLRKALIRGVTTPDDIEQHLGLPVYAVIPYEPSARVSRKAHGHPVVWTQSDSLAAEGIKSLRTALEFGLPNRDGSNVIGICSPLTDVGKTFVSSNLAAAYHDLGKRVLVVDADLRRGNLHRQFSVDGRPGLAELLAGKGDDIAPLEVRGGMHVLPAGYFPPNPTNLLMSTAFRTQVDIWRRLFDVVIIDTPPVLNASDASVVASVADASFVVVRGGRTTLEEVRETLRRLRPAEATGIVLNGLARSHASYGNYGGYARAYKS